MKSRLLGTACVCVAMWTVCEGANAAFFTDLASFEAANPGLTTLDFEGLVAPPVQSVRYTTPADFAITTPGAHPLIIDKDIIGNPVFPVAPSDYLCAPCLGPTQALDMSFNVAVDAIGFNLAIAINGDSAGGGNVNVNVFNGTTVLGSQVYAAGGVGTFDTFVGFSDLGTITRFTVSSPTGASGAVINGAFHNIDNLSYASAVPVPAAFYLFGSGLLGLLGVAGRRAS